MDKNILQEEILKLITTYEHIGFYLTKNEIKSFLSCQVDDLYFDVVVEDLVSFGKIKKNSKRDIYWTSGVDPSDKKNYIYSDVKIAKNKLILSLLSKIPSILFIGITGSCAHEISKVDDDIDLILVTKKNSLFVTRALVLFISHLFGKRRTISGPVKNKLCVNILLEDGNLVVPYPKRTMFSVREMVNIRSYCDKNFIKDKLIISNKKLMQQFTPNFKMEYDAFAKKNNIQMIANIFSKNINSTLMFIELWYLKPKVTNELVNSRQLWFHPNTRQN
ncbi:MAG: hypothetical protein U0525_01485 [Patescibacteria group bacterium]